MDRIIILADIDYFYSQAEELRDPAIKGKPVVVCVYSGRTEDSGVIATSNYEARKYGVKAGMPIALAKKRLVGTDAKFLPVDFPYYRKVSGRVMEILKAHSDSFEQVSIDEAYLDVSARVKNYEEAENLAKEIKRKVREAEGLTISLGIGPNKIVAKMACDAAKPDGLLVIRPGDVQSFFSSTPVDRMPGVGKKTAERMEKLGIKTVGELARFSPIRLIEEFGEGLGMYLHLAANGKDEEPVEGSADKDSISRIVTLREDTKDFKTIAERVEGICLEISRRVAEEGILFRSVGIIAITSGLDIKTRTRKLPAPTNDFETLKREALSLLKKFLQESGRDLRRIGVHVSDLTRIERGQRTLTNYLG